MKKQVFALLLLLSTSIFVMYAEENDTELTENQTVEAAENIESKNLSLHITEGQKGLLTFGNTDKFILADEISLFTENAFGALKQKTGTITVYPKEKILGFGTSHLMAYCLCFFDADNADILEKAVLTYLSDFENKKLERTKKTIKKYGNATGSLYWGPSKTSTPNNGKGKCSLGYKFIEKSPYFTITFYPLKNNYAEVDAGADKQSMNITFYFTKAQATNLVSFISRENINSIFDIYEQNAASHLSEGDSY